MLSLIAINSIILSNSIVFLSNTFESQSMPWRKTLLIGLDIIISSHPWSAACIVQIFGLIIYCTRNFKICLASHLICLLKLLTDTVNLKTEEKKKIIRWGWVKGSGTWCSEGNLGSSPFTRKEEGLEAMEMS